MNCWLDQIWSRLEQRPQATGVLYEALQAARKIASSQRKSKQAKECVVNEWKNKRAEGPDKVCQVPLPHLDGRRRECNKMTNSSVDTLGH
jgi:hypothetical protein